MSREIIFKEPELKEEIAPLFLKEVVQESIQKFLVLLGDRPLINLHDLFLEEVEAPLLTAVMTHFNHNQSKAAILLGMSRGTLRKKLIQYGLI